MKSEIIVDLKKIVYCKYLLPYAGTSIVIVHGFSDHKEKYRDIVKMFLAKGFSVYILDLPGHGESDGHIDDKNLYHIDRFDDYVFALKHFINDVVRRDSQNKIAIYSQSMGGLISTLLLEENPNIANALILSAPMFKIKTGLPDFYLNFITSVMSRFFPKGRIFFKRKGEKAPTWKWLYESMIASKVALLKENAIKITIPILLLQADNDNVIENSVIDIFSTYYKNIKKFKYANSTHNLHEFNGKLREEYFNDIFNFLRLKGL